MLDFIFSCEEDSVHKEAFIEELNIFSLLKVENLRTLDVLSAETTTVIEIADDIVVRRVCKTVHSCNRFVVNAINHDVDSLS